ncbi:MAG: hypothetical protein H7Z41_16370 [Cytophagales bacterium]|nr:hypothetical protein [Armatimonadota bacterium]
MSQPQDARAVSTAPVVSGAPSDNDALLRQIQIAAPCSAKWADMPGGEKVRSCSQCSRKVYNLSAMSSIEAANLIREAEGRVCVRLYRRADGSVMTRDCPTGLRAVRQRTARALSVSLASIFSILGLFSLAERFRSAATTGNTRPAPVALPVHRTTGSPAPPATMGAPTVMMGEMTPEAALIATPEPKAASQHTMGKVSVTAAAKQPRFLPLPTVAPTPDADKTFLPLESQPSEIRDDPFAPLAEDKNAVQSALPARP